MSKSMWHIVYELPERNYLEISDRLAGRANMSLTVHTQWKVHLLSQCVVKKFITPQMPLQSADIQTVCIL
jgi:hypothetical protein